MSGLPSEEEEEIKSPAFNDAAFAISKEEYPPKKKDAIAMNVRERKFTFRIIVCYPISMIN